VRDNRWQDRWKDVPVDLAEKTILIVGFGRIGTRTAKRCLAMDMTVLIYDPYVPAATIKAAGCEAVTDLESRAAARRRRLHPLPEDARDGEHVQCRAPRAHEAERLHHQHRARRHHR
jgi:hypothetical protein